MPSDSIICLNGGSIPFSFTAGAQAGTNTLTLSPSSGSDAPLFAPYQFSLLAQGYVNFVSANTGGVAITVPPGATLSLRLLAYGVSATSLNLQVSVSTAATGAFSQTLLQFTAAAINTTVFVQPDGSSLISLLYTDASNAASTATYQLTVTVIGGSSASLFRATSTMYVNLNPTSNAPPPPPSGQACNVPAPPTGTAAGSCFATINGGTSCTLTLQSGLHCYW